MKTRARLAVFVAPVIGLAVVVLFLAGVRLSPSTITWCWVLACLAGEAFWIRTPTHQGTISMALTIDLAAIVALGLRESLPIIAITTFAAGIFPHRRPVLRAVFNAAQSSLAAAAASWTLNAMNPDPENATMFTVMTTWPALFSAGAVFYFVNTMLVAMAISIETESSFWTAWRQNYGYGFELACSVAQISLAGFVLMAYQQMGPASVLALLPVLAVLWWSSAREARTRSSSAPGAEEEPKKLKLVS
jgi:hypothetical protein